MSDLTLLECLRDGVKADFSNPDTATIAMIQAADLIEAQQAEIAEYKKQIKQMGRTVQHYEHLAMKFSSQAEVYDRDRQRAWAEIARLRELLRDARDNGLCYWEPCTERGWKAKEAMVGAINVTLEQKP